MPTIPDNTRTIPAIITSDASSEGNTMPASTSRNPIISEIADGAWRAVFQKDCFDFLVLAMIGIYSRSLLKLMF
jgi:hypothetical protein